MRWTDLMRRGSRTDAAADKGAMADVHRAWHEIFATDRAIASYQSDIVQRRAMLQNIQRLQWDLPPTDTFLLLQRENDMNVLVKKIKVLDQDVVRAREHRRHIEADIRRALCAALRHDFGVRSRNRPRDRPGASGSTMGGPWGMAGIFGTLVLAAMGFVAVFTNPLFAEKNLPVF